MRACARRCVISRTAERLFDARRRKVDAPPNVAFAPIRRIGGERGWYAFDRLWTVRGRIDGWLGGVGARRGRPDPERLRVGDPLDWWRVEAFEPNRRLRLLAETRLPGRAWLEFEVEPSGRGAIISQTVTFEPSGLLGRIYWASVLPLHHVVFEAMLDGIENAVGAEPRKIPGSLRVGNPGGGRRRDGA